LSISPKAFKKEKPSKYTPQNPNYIAKQPGNQEEAPSKGLARLKWPSCLHGNIS
jgi:hypothetical protein